jgi:hypothetical protein
MTLTGERGITVEIRIIRVRIIELRTPSSKEIIEELLHK